MIPWDEVYGTGGQEVAGSNPASPTIDSALGGS